MSVDAETAKNIAKISAVNFGSIFIEVMSFPKLKKDMQSHVKIIGLEQRQARAWGGDNDKPQR